MSQSIQKRQADQAPFVNAAQLARSRETEIQKALEHYYGEKPDHAAMRKECEFVVCFGGAEMLYIKDRPALYFGPIQSDYVIDSCESGEFMVTVKHACDIVRLYQGEKMP